MTEQTCQGLTKLAAEHPRKSNRITPKVKTSFTQYDLILLLKWIILHRNMPGICKAPCPRIEMHGGAPPTGRRENYRPKWRWKGIDRTTMALVC
jgi:hypothetical protein